MVDISVFILLFSSEKLGRVPIILNLIIIIVALLPIICIKSYISHTIRILDFYINRNKLLKNVYIVKGIIQQIKAYGFVILGLMAIT